MAGYFALATILLICASTIVQVQVYLALLGRMAIVG